MEESSLGYSEERDSNSFTTALANYQGLYPLSARLDCCECPPPLSSSTTRHRKLIEDIELILKTEPPTISRALLTFSIRNIAAALLECCHVGQRILYNLTRTKGIGFITDRISIIAEDSQRSSVVRMHSIKLESIRSIMSGLFEAAETVRSSPDFRPGLDDLTEACDNMLGPRSLDVSDKDTEPLDF